MSNVIYLIVAYAVVGLALGVYAFALRRQHRSLSGARHPAEAAHHL